MLEMNLILKKMIKELVILSSPRCGTNYFCDTLSSFNKNFQMMESFNPAGVFGIQRRGYMVRELSESMECEFSDAKDPRLVEYFKSNPVAAINKVNDIASLHGEQLLSYKIFPNQLSKGKLWEIVGRDCTECLFILRGRLDTYISYQKAISMNTWHKSKTDSTLVKVDIDDFLSWAKTFDQWFDNCLELVLKNNKRPYFISYESDINTSKKSLIEKQYLALKTLGIDLDYPKKISSTRFNKQDRNVGPFMKISNGEQLRGDLRSRKKYNYALSKPLL